MAKVGGGWMNIDTFIDTYEGLEEEKFKMNSDRDFANNNITTKGPSGLTTSHPTQMVTTLGHSPLLVLVETSTAT